MNTSKISHGKTYITRTYPWGIHPRNGHRLLCADGKIRAATLAPTADTFFSIPASVRVNGRHVSGYATCDESSTGEKVWTFCRHDSHADKLPSFLGKSQAEKDDIIHAAH